MVKLPHPHLHGSHKPEHLPLASSIAPRLVWLESTGSTNEVLVAAATGADAATWPDLAVVATDDQVAGRGRLGRTWTAPAGASLAISVLLRPVDAAGAAIPLERWGMLPLLAGVAMSRVVGRLVAASHGRTDGADTGPGRVALKWPNDVLIGERKVCGILGELLPGGAGLVIGSGVNLTLSAEDLPTPTATSLVLAGVGDVSADAVLAGYLSDLTSLYERWCAHGGDPVASGLLAAATECSATLGRAVRVELPGGELRVGVARALDETGRLVIDLTDGSADPEGAPLVVSAGDVTHLRHHDS